MPRLLKPGLDFFQHDTSMSSDEALEALEALYGNDGYAVFNKLLERIYKSNGKLNLSDDITRLSLAKKFNVTTERFDKIIEDAVRFGLFDRDIWDTEKRLTSHRIREQLGLVEIIREREREKKKKAKQGKPELSPGKTGIIPGENGDYPSGKVHRVEESREEKSNIREREGEREQEPSPAPPPPPIPQGTSKLGILKNVTLSPVECSELRRLYRDGIVDDYINRLSTHLDKTGKTYRSHYAAILDWLNRDGVEQRASSWSTAKPQEPLDDELSPEAKAALTAGLREKLRIPSG